jgi:hypothetical protein
MTDGGICQRVFSSFFHPGFFLFPILIVILMLKAEVLKNCQLERRSLKIVNYK